MPGQIARSSIRVAVSRGVGQGDTLVSLQSFRETARLFPHGRLSTALASTNPSWMNWAALNEDERTMEEVGNVNFKRAGLWALCLRLPGGRGAGNGCKSISGPPFHSSKKKKKYLRGFEREQRVKRAEICFDNIIHNIGFALCELITLRLQSKESGHGISS